MIIVTSRGSLLSSCHCYYDQVIVASENDYGYYDQVIVASENDYGYYDNCYQVSISHNFVLSLFGCLTILTLENSNQQ